MLSAVRTDIADMVRTLDTNREQRAALEAAELPPETRLMTLNYIFQEKAGLNPKVELDAIHAVSETMRTKFIKQQNAENAKFEKEKKEFEPVEAERTKVQKEMWEQAAADEGKVYIPPGVFDSEPVQWSIPKALSAVSQNKGKGYTELSQAFLEMIVLGGYMKEFVNVAHDFTDLVAYETNEVDVWVQSAAPLKSAQKKKLVTKLQTLVEPGIKLTLGETIDPQLIGGFIVNLGGSTIDCSVNTQIQEYSRSMQELSQ